jgi:histidinol phosphatase-like enzyme
VEILPGRSEVLRRYREKGWLLLGASWQPGNATPELSPALLERRFARTNELLGVEIDVVWCRHAAGAPACWCRKPLPGLGALLIQRHGLERDKCTMVGRSATDRAFAARLGFGYAEAEEFFSDSPA